MRIHNTEIDPTTVTRLTIEHAHGMLDLSGDTARAVLAQLRPQPGALHPTQAAVLRALSAGSLTSAAVAVAVGLSPVRACRVLTVLHEAGMVDRSGTGRRNDAFVYTATADPVPHPPPRPAARHPRRRLAAAAQPGRT